MPASAPAGAAETQSDAQPTSDSTSAPADATQAFAQQLAAFQTLTNASSTATLSAFLAAIAGYERRCTAAAAGRSRVPRPEPIHLEVAGYDKAKRTAVHAFFRDRQLPRMQTDSITGDGKDARGPEGGAGVQSIKVTYLPLVRC